MRRRELIALAGGAAATWPLDARAQQPAMPVVGFMHPTSHEAIAHQVAGFRRGLRETGYVEGQNVKVDYLWADSHTERLRELAAEFVRRRVAVIAATGGDGAALAAQAATKTIPIVINASSDPVTSGFVASFSRPGGNITGVSQLSVDLLPKRLEMLCEVVPNATVIGLLVNSTGLNKALVTPTVEAAARVLGRQIEVFQANSDEEIEAALVSFTRSRARALLIANHPVFNARSEYIAALTLKYAIPAMYQIREFVAAGGLMSYGASFVEAYRLVGVYTGQILKGAKPADLPVQQQTRVDLVINLKTARALGLKVPLGLLALADEVIE
jgi:putative ABC transport system substrate-binding protein